MRPVIAPFLSTVYWVRDRSDALLRIVIGSAAAAVAWESRGMSSVNGAFPRVVALAVIVLVVMISAKSRLPSGLRMTPEAADPGPDSPAERSVAEGEGTYSDPEEGTAPTIRRLRLAIGLLYFIAASYLLGVLIASLSAIGILAVALEAGWPRALVLTVAGSLVLYGFFVAVVGVRVGGGVVF